jgi:hypothetical protein
MRLSLRFRLTSPEAQTQSHCERQEYAIAPQKSAGWQHIEDGLAVMLTVVEPIAQNEGNDGQAGLHCTFEYSSELFSEHANSVALRATRICDCSAEVSRLAAYRGRSGCEASAFH